MSKKPEIKSLDELFGEEESILSRRHRERIEAERARLATPEGQAEAKRQAEEREARQATEHEKGVRLGWWDADGNPLNEPDSDADDEIDDDDGDAGPHDNDQT